MNFFFIFNWSNCCEYWEQGRDDAKYGCNCFHMFFALSYCWITILLYSSTFAGKYVFLTASCCQKWKSRRTIPFYLLRMREGYLKNYQPIGWLCLVLQQVESVSTSPVDGWRRTVLGGWSRAGCGPRRSPVRCWVSVELRMVVGRGSSSWRVGSGATPWRWRSRWWSIRRMRIARSGWWYGCWRWRGRTVRTCRNRSSLRGASNLRWWRYPYCVRMNALQMNKTNQSNGKACIKGKCICCSPVPDYLDPDDPTPLR